MSESIYYEDTIQEFGVAHNWYNATIKDSIVTSRGTKVEMVERPQWGLACYMDNSIQSGTIDEKIYHEALVHPVMSSIQERKRVMIIGGGENASIICQEHGLFEGNFIRSIMKMANMLDEWLAMATYCQHTEQVDKIMEVRQKIIRDIVISDSLYLHL